MQRTLVKKIIELIYKNTIRSYLPKKISTHAGIPARYPRLFDSKDTFPDHPKKRLIQMTRDGVHRGDSVVIVGGGMGIAPAAAASTTGPTGNVDIYEGSGEHIQTLEETMKINAVSDWTSINHAIVGEAIDLAGKRGNPELINPSELPACDFLQLDCEGAEIDILRGLGNVPDRILVETHPRKNADTEKVMRLLSDMGYEKTREKEDPVSGDIILATHSTGASLTR